MNDEAPPMTVGGIPLVVPSVQGANLNILLWGDSGAGKTTASATAPGRKLFLLFDPTGDMSLTGRSDVEVLNLTAETPLKVMTQFRTADPYGLDKFLQSRPDIETVVIDSVTSLSYIALQDAVVRAGGRSSLEQPGQHGYTYRNAALTRVTSVMIQMCARHKRNFIAITHEGAANRDDSGVTQSVTTVLSDSLENSFGAKFNEVWWMSDTGTERRIAIRPCRLRKPMKTRMFDSSGAPEFVWHYDSNTGEGEGIAEWFRAWQDGGGKKLPLPARPTTLRGGAKR